MTEARLDEINTTFDEALDRVAEVAGLSDAGASWMLDRADVAGFEQRLLEALAEAVELDRVLG